MGRRSKKKPKKPKKTNKPKRKSKKPKKKPEDSDMDHEDSDVDHEDSDEDHEDSDMDHEDSDMDYYGHDGYPSRKYTQTRKSRPSYLHHRRYRRSAGLSRSQLKKYRMSQEARFRRMQSAAGQKRRRKIKHMRAKKYYYM